MYLEMSKVLLVMNFKYEFCDVLFFFRFNFFNKNKLFIYVFDLKILYFYESEWWLECLGLVYVLW